jgi:hypothetical protein
MTSQLTLFDLSPCENLWEEHYVGMPEYNNVREPDPLITATFKFRTQEDFEEFNKLIKQHLYDGERVFDGMQRKDVKSTWYPLRCKASKYRFV